MWVKTTCCCRLCLLLIIRNSFYNLELVQTHTSTQASTCRRLQPSLVFRFYWKGATTPQLLYQPICLLVCRCQPTENSTLPPGTTFHEFLDWILLAHIKTYEDLDSSITHQKFRNSNFISQHAINLKQSDHCHQNIVMNPKTCIKIQNQLKPQKFMCQTIYATSMKKTYMYTLLPSAQPAYTSKDYES